MFNLDLSGKYWCTVSFTVPGESGQRQDMTFDVEFRRYVQAELDDMTQRATDRRLSDTDLAREVTVGWRNVVGTSGSVEFSRDAFNRLLGVPGAGSAVMKAFFESISKGLEKNS